MSSTGKSRVVSLFPPPRSCRCPAVQADALRMEKPNFLGKQGMYGGLVCVNLLQIAFELVFQFLTRRGLGVL